MMQCKIKDACPCFLRLRGSGQAGDRFSGGASIRREHPLPRSYQSPATAQHGLQDPHQSDWYCLQYLLRNPLAGLSLHAREPSGAGPASAHTPAHRLRMTHTRARARTHTHTHTHTHTNAHTHRCEPSPIAGVGPLPSPRPSLPELSSMRNRLLQRCFSGRHFAIDPASVEGSSGIPIF